MNIFIEPSDVWLFRDGRPFAPNERGRAVSLFPPTQRTMQGAIRSARIAQSGASFIDQSTWPPDVGTPDKFGSLKIRGPLIGKRKNNGELQRFFPLAADLTQLQDGWHVLSPRADDMKTQWPKNAKLLPLLPPRGSEPVKFEGGWMCEDALLAYLKGNACGVHVHRNKELYVPEPRFGVQIDSHPKRPSEGMLYQVEFIRSEDGVGLLLEVKGLSLASSGLLQLGGEARAGRYDTVTMGVDLPPDGRISDTDNPLRFKLYLATRALFEQGWLPKDIDAQTMKGNWCGISLTLVSAAIGKPQSIGGRDISRRDQQRSMRRAVPAGSVYFFETEARAGDVFEAFDGKCVSDREMDAQIGFGLSYVGGWNYV